MGSKHYTRNLYTFTHTQKSFNFFWNCIRQAVGSKSLWRLFLELEPEILVFWSFHFNSISFHLLPLLNDRTNLFHWRSSSALSLVSLKRLVFRPSDILMPYWNAALGKASLLFIYSLYSSWVSKSQRPKGPFLLPWSILL